ncbi:MAG: hypothetical protein JWR61_2376 [Ferruginibacter sp.]|nr:hypothetical protein [Ferruginibacter sp.]
MAAVLIPLIQALIHDKQLPRRHMIFIFFVVRVS